MNGLMEHLRSADFWVFSVTMAVLLSVLANYATRLIDQTFFRGQQWVRSLTRRSRERRAARIEAIHNWINAHNNGSMLVLAEGHFLMLVAFVFLIATLLGLGLAFALRPQFKSFQYHLWILSVSVLFVSISMAATNTGGTLLEAVRKHPNGLLGLHLNSK